MKTLPVQYPAKVATAYVLIASIYLVFSDLLVKRLSDSVQQIGHLQTLKGWGFILVTAIALYVVLRHKWQQLQAEIAARQQAERELRRLNEELESRVAQRTADLSAAREAAENADRVKSAFLATMSHELRTPLNSIIGFTGMLAKELTGPLNDEQRKQLSIVQNCARHLHRLISDVLDISRIEAGQMLLEEITFDLQVALERVLMMVMPLAEDKGLTLHWSPLPTPFWVTTDQLRLEQVVVNLLNNAVKFTEQGSVRIECAAQGDDLRIVVTDTGIGIAPEYREHLFRPFYQIDNTLHRRYEGTGLGLFICQRLLALMGGSIDVQSTLGQGSTFTVLLPRETRGRHHGELGAILSATDEARYEGTGFGHRGQPIQPVPDPVFA